jgi:4-amino-4-deoxy-L-arabinose transferase-like glycosyltransferase
MHRSEPSWLLFPVFGLVLALDYFAKMVMFPLAFVFLFCAFFAGKPGSARALRTASALAVFLLVSAPWLFALSHQKHRFTFGDTGKLSYVMYINGIVKLPHWHGEDPLTGVPLHTTRRIHEFPSVDEFATPIAGSYPPWYDASYWDEGAHPILIPVLNGKACSKPPLSISAWFRRSAVSLSGFSSYACLQVTRSFFCAPSSLCGPSGFPRSPLLPSTSRSTWKRDSSERV